ncbi:MAG: NAD(P)-dependent oxidoreductase, partial [Bryobacteraceae bacterium]
GFFDAERFGRMKPSAYFINTSRGVVVREPDLIEALESGRIAGASLDVRAKEPPERGKLESMPNVLLMPHIAAFTREAQERVNNAICHDVARVLDGKPAQNATGAAMPARLVS